jgi:uncharacterized protein YjbJ (UPF0337 family)/uncharacterized membrane protein YtjA (UPF0391 family)
VGNLLHYAVVFLVVALAAAALGFGGVAGTAMEGARILFWVAIILFVISLVAGLVRRGSPWTQAQHNRRANMNWDRIEGNWKQFSGKVKEKWGQLTDDDMTAINGRREQLEGKLQERYGYGKEQVRKEVDDWLGHQ